MMVSVDSVFVKNKS